LIFRLLASDQGLPLASSLGEAGQRRPQIDVGEYCHALGSAGQRCQHASGCVQIGLPLGLADAWVVGCTQPAPRIDREYAGVGSAGRLQQPGGLDQAGVVPVADVEDVEGAPVLGC